MYSEVHITSTDLMNSIKYAKMKCLYENTKNYNQLEWVYENKNNSPNYNCPSTLTCYDGHVRIASKDECNKRSNFKQYLDNKDAQPNPKNGWYLEWRLADQTNPDSGQCYLGDYANRLNCSGPKADLSSKLYWDDNTQRCLMTKEYCDSTGKGAYTPGKEANGNGGSCDLTGNQKAIDFFLGETVAQTWGYNGDSVDFYLNLFKGKACSQ